MKRKKLLALFLAILMIAPMLTSLTVEAYEVRSPHMYAHSYAVMDANTGKILFGENVNKKIYPASTAKIMSAIVTVESGMDLDTVVTAKSNIVYNTTYGTYKLGMRAGDKYTLEQLLNMSLISSASDATDTMAAAVGGSKKAFAELMMKKVKEMGLKKTSFDNPVGSDKGGGFYKTYSTAAEMCEIARYAMTLPTIRNIVAKKTYTIRGGSLSGRTINNTNWFYNQYPYNRSAFTIIGTKTGQTTAAGDVFIATAIDDEGHELICAYFGRGGKRETFRWIDNLLSYAMREYKKGNLTLKKGAYNTRYHEDSNLYLRGINAGGIPVHSGKVDFKEALTEKELVKLIKGILKPEVTGRGILHHFDDAKASDKEATGKFFSTALGTALPGMQNCGDVKKLLDELTDTVTVKQAVKVLKCAIQSKTLYQVSLPICNIPKWTPENPMPFVTVFKSKLYTPSNK